MDTRPVCLFGAAFLVTGTAALFVPVLLFPLVLPLGFCLVFFPAKRVSLTALALGVLGAALCCGVFLAREGGTRELVGREYPLTGVLFQLDGAQLLDARFPDGTRHLVELSPPIPAHGPADWISCTVRLTDLRYDSSLYTLSGGVLLTGTTEAPVLLPPSNGQTPLPLTIQALLLRERLAQGFLDLNAAPSTGVTCGILFSYREGIDPATRQAFSRSGLGHLLSVSGLHLTILCWMVLAVVRRLGGGRTTQALAGIAASLLLYLAAGMTPGVFRAAIMTSLTLLAGLVLRRSDGLTSLAVAAVLLCGFCPPMVADLSFQLSFLSVLGILVLAPRLTEHWRQWVVSRKGRCGPLAGGLLGATAISLAAQVFTAPVVAWQFGAVPLLALALNLIAIPLCYPILLCGLGAAGALLAGFGGLASALLLCANLCSLLLSVLARFAGSLPFGSLPTRFPLDYLAVGLGILCVLIPVFSPGGRFRRIFGTTAAAALLTAVASLALTWTTVTLASSSVSGSLILADRTGAVVLEQPGGFGYYDRRLLERLGYQEAVVLSLPLAEPTPLLPGVLAQSPTPYTTEFQIGHTKIVKFGAVYDTIIKYGGTVPRANALLADRAGNLLSLNGDQYILRRENGESLLRLFP